MPNALQRTLDRAIQGLHSHRFVRLIQTHTLSSAGDGLVTVALAGSVFFNEDPNSARTRVAFTLILTFLPFAVVAPFLGPLIDRMKRGRRVVLSAASAARAVFCLLMVGSLESVALYPIAFLTLVASKTHAVAKSASVPEIVDDQNSLVRANSVLAVGAVISGFVAAMVGFVVSTLGGADWVLRAGALIFVLASALALEAGVPGHWRDSVETTDKMPGKIGSSPLHAAVVMATLRGSVGFLAFLIAFDLRRAGATTLWFGVAIAAGMIGSSLGNVLAPRVRRLVREETMLAGSAYSMSVLALVMASVSGRMTACALALVLGACAATAKLAFDSIVQRDTAVERRGRSFARFEAAFQGVWVIGALIPVALTIDLMMGFSLLAVATAVAATWFVLRRPAQLQVDARQP